MRKNKQNNQLVNLNRKRVVKPSELVRPLSARAPTIDFVARDRYTHMHRVKRALGLRSLSELPVKILWAFRARRLMRVG